MFQLTLKLDYQNAQIAEQAIEGMAQAIAWFEEPGQKTISADVFAERWELQAIFTQKPDLKIIKNLLRDFGCNYTKITLEKLPPTDWLKKNQESFPPIHAGRFLVRSNLDPIQSAELVKQFPAKQHIVIDAATAFGTGQHSSTYGCLLAIDRLSRTRKFSNILDMGCGTAILAMGSAKMQPRARITALDIDPEAVRVSNINLRVNHLHPRITTGLARGFANASVRGRGKYDLVLANILAKPLTRMARDMQFMLRPGAFVVLSGLLANQERMVAGTYARLGLRFCGRITRDGWHTLILQK